jgi:hypothetical protein
VNLSGLDARVSTTEADTHALIHTQESQTLNLLVTRVLIHAHVVSYWPRLSGRRVGRTLVVNAIPYRLLEL